MPVESHGRTRMRAKVNEKPVVEVRETARAPVIAHGRSRKRKGNIDPLHISLDQIPDGWTYQWCRQSTHGQPDDAHQTALAENGWTPVPSSRHVGMFMPKGHEGDITRGGLILMERPSELTAEARAEEKALARSLVQAQKEQLGLAMPQGFDGNHPGVRPQVRTSYEPGLPQARQQIAVD